MDADGYLWYQGRSDDVFKSSGYRIGPSEIENCLVKHPAVANAAVVPKPDAERGAVVKAYVVLAPGFVGDGALVAALQQHVRARLAPYEYPKEIEFIDAAADDHHRQGAAPRAAPAGRGARPRRRPASVPASACPVLLRGSSSAGLRAARQGALKHRGATPGSVLGGAP
jgi:acyl-CoA synthetase (AMP-forming)/AMP-acid ligase II